MKTGIVLIANGGYMQQPYLVWWNGEIVYFAKTMPEAERVLEKERARHDRLVTRWQNT